MRGWRLSPSLSHLIVLGPVGMLVLLSVVLGVDRYRSGYKLTLDSAIQVGKVAAQPVHDLVSTSMGGGNYANVQAEPARNLFGADPRLRFMVVEGRTDVRGEDFGFVFDGATKTVHRTVWSEASLADLADKVARAEQALATMPGESARASQIRDRLALWRDELERSRLDRNRAGAVVAGTERPAAADLVDGAWLDRSTWTLHLMLPTKNSGGGTVWMVLDASQLANLGPQVLKRLLFINIVGLLVVAGMSIFLSGLVVNPLRRLTGTMRAMAAGDYSQPLRDIDRRDEVGEMARALQVFKANAETLDRVVSGALDNARHVSMSASQASAAVTQVSGGARSQLDAVKQVASALEQSADAISDVARSTQSASQQSREITGLVAQGTEHVTGMVDLVRGIADDSTQIARLVADIAQIADQTNMLALNAAIEAAHGGQNSGGFTVIADEVRKLSENTHVLAQKIGEITAAAAQRVHSGLRTAESIAGSIRSIGDIVRRNEALVSAIATSVEQQQSVVADIRLSVKELNNIGQANASASEEIAVTMHQLADMAGDTTRQMEGVRRSS